MLWGGLGKRKDREMNFKLLHYTPVSLVFLEFAIDHILRITICLDLYMPGINTFRVYFELGSFYRYREWIFNKQ